MTVWICFICVERVHPVTRPLKRIICGHAVCAACIDLLVKFKQSCPLRCPLKGDKKALTPGDARTLDISVVETEADEDDLAALQVLQAFFEKRNRLVKSLDQNSAVLDRLAQRIANQLSFLERVTGRIQKVSAERKQTLLDLYGAQEHLNMETSKRARLLESLKEAQVKFTAAEQRIKPFGSVLLLEDVGAQSRAPKRRSEGEVSTCGQKKRRTM